MSALPDYRYKSLSDIPIEEFASRGIKGALIDIDNTLIPYGEYENIPTENREWLDRAKKAGVRCLLYSNATQRKISKLEKVSGLPGVPKAYKPSVKEIPKALKILGLKREEVVMVGDQWCTDILSGYFAGIKTILVEPLTMKDWWGTKILRAIEMLALSDRRPWRKTKPKFDK
ncbi:MAG: YqeG family HAD IIIA-type phosphatase [bacterium]|nr:YqeG family HAD IIIA-type phosphatase [bacterium]